MYKILILVLSLLMISNSSELNSILEFNEQIKLQENYKGNLKIVDYKSGCLIFDPRITDSVLKFDYYESELKKTYKYKTNKNVRDVSAVLINNDSIYVATYNGTFLFKIDENKLDFLQFNDSLKADKLYLKNNKLISVQQCFYCGKKGTFLSIYNKSLEKELEKELLFNYITLKIQSPRKYIEVTDKYILLIDPLLYDINIYNFNLEYLSNVSVRNWKNQQSIDQLLYINQDGNFYSIIEQLNIITDNINLIFRIDAIDNQTFLINYQLKESEDPNFQYDILKLNDKLKVQEIKSYYWKAKPNEFFIPENIHISNNYIIDGGYLYLPTSLSIDVKNYIESKTTREYYNDNKAKDNNFFTGKYSSVMKYKIIISSK